MDYLKGGQTWRWMMNSGDKSEAARYQRPDGTPKRTGRTLTESVATVVVEDTPADNQRVTIHVEHPDHDGGVRAFWRPREFDIAQSIRKHLRTELMADLARVEVIDEAGVGIAESEVLPRRLSRTRPFEEPTAVEVSAP